MENAARLHILEPAQDLIEEELDVLVTQGLARLDNCSKICLHEVSDNVEFIEGLE